MNQIRVLLVDRNREFLAAAADFLADDPELTVVGQSRSTQLILEQIARLQPDVVLMDLDMPLLNGVITVLNLKVLADSPPVVIVTDSAEPPYRELAESISCDGFIAKSDFCTDVVPMIKHLVAPVPSGLV